jgi:hypothetical protein
MNVAIKVVVTHPSGSKDEIWIKSDSTRNVPTDEGQVTILVSVYDPNSSSSCPYESRTLPSDHSVYIQSIKEGKPKIRRVKYGTLRECYSDEANY